MRRSHDACKKIYAVRCPNCNSAKLPHAAQAGRFRQIDALGERAVGQAALVLEGLQNRAVEAVEFHDARIRRCWAG